MKKQILIVAAALLVLGAQPAMHAQSWVTTTLINTLNFSQQHPARPITNVLAGMAVGLALILCIDGNVRRNMYKDLRNCCSLPDAVQSNNFWRAYLLLKSGVSQIEKERALDSAIRLKKSRFVKLLLNNGAAAYDTHWEFPVECAALERSTSYPEVFFKLLLYGLDPFYSNDDTCIGILYCAYSDVVCPKQVANMACLLYILESSEKKVAQCKSAVLHLEQMIEKGNNYIRNYESRMAELQQNEEVDQASIDFLQQNIINQNNCVQKCQEELERVRQFANPIMTDEKKAMVADILTSLTDQEKETFRQVLSVRYQHTQNLLIALILYEYFDDAVSLKKYLKERAPIATRLSNKIPAAMYTHVMSFLRSNSDDIEQRLTAALRKAITQKDEELSGLLVQNGAELDINEKIEAQFN